jgi:crotonobetainyl-CoA:carnitine CoA-transferase CaiB-like acyl-CoA transferase
VDELVERAALLGIAGTAVGEVADDRPVIAERVGDAPTRPLKDAVVVNLAALWAGPLCADLLARLGARVITIESTRRPDGGRQARKFFAALHGRSESVALDLGGPHGRRLLAELLHGADVVIEGSRPRALEQMGIDARRLLDEGPRVWLSITAHGRDGTARHRVGFGDDAAAAGRLVGWVGGEPRFVADAVADPLSGLTAACAAAVAIEDGGRWLLDVALARTAASAAGGWIARSGTEQDPPRVRRDPGAPMPLGRDTAAVLDRVSVRRGVGPSLR